MSYRSKAHGIFNIVVVKHPIYIIANIKKHSIDGERFKNIFQCAGLAKACYDGRMRSVRAGVEVKLSIHDSGGMRRS